MTPDDRLDELLQLRFAALREADAGRAPAFTEMMARARAVAAEQPVSPVALQNERTARHPWRRPRNWAIAAPFAVAAALAGIWLQPDRVADREFEKVVSEWARTAQRARSSPTDALLALPGDEYLRRLPALGGGAGSTWRPS